jgi:hypothetical protein
MTAEIAVLNRNGIALAADSAVTLQLPEGSKIYHTHKLFTLSKYRPVGIMIYGSAGLMGVPWETIIKLYRKNLGTKGFPTIEKYGADFFSFVERHRTLFPESLQQGSCYQMTRVWLNRLKMQLRRAVENELKGGDDRIPAARVQQLFAKIVDDEIDGYKKRPIFPRFEGLPIAKFLKRYGPTIRKALREELADVQRPVPLKRLLEGFALGIRHQSAWFAESGIVIAGFGEDDIMPSLCCHSLDSVIGGRLRVLENKDKRCQLSHTGVTASVIAFAQSEMVSLFMNGIDDDYALYVNSFAKQSFLKGYPEMVAKVLENHLGALQKDEALKKLEEVGKQLSEKFASNIRDYATQAHSNPIVEIVNHLPKEELAVMAEALVNLTSLKRHVTKQAETVGGPIDVAIISRGDGFVWIKRKHYFNRELNPQFMENYFRNGV